MCRAASHIVATICEMGLRLACIAEHQVTEFAPMPHKELLEAWRRADNDAREAEEKLEAQLTACAEGRGPQPPQAQVMEAKLLRHGAMALFSQYIEAASRAETESPASGKANP